MCFYEIIPPLLYQNIIYTNSKYNRGNLSFIRVEDNAKKLKDHSFQLFGQCLPVFISIQFDFKMVFLSKQKFLIAFLQITRTKYLCLTHTNHIKLHFLAGRFGDENCDI